MGLALNPQSKLARSSTRVWLVLQLLDLLQFHRAAVTTWHLSVSRRETEGTTATGQKVPASCSTSSKLATASLQSTLLRLSNDVSCSVFGLAVFVIVSYYYLLFSGQIEDSDKVKQFYLILSASAEADAVTRTLTFTKHKNNSAGPSMDLSCFTHWQCDSSST